jgi:hypothetical protein
MNLLYRAPHDIRLISCDAFCYSLSAAVRGIIASVYTMSIVYTATFLFEVGK